MFFANCNVKKKASHSTGKSARRSSLEQQTRMENAKETKLLTSQRNEPARHRSGPKVDKPLQTKSLWNHLTGIVSKSKVAKTPRSKSMQPRRNSLDVSQWLATVDESNLEECSKPTVPFLNLERSSHNRESKGDISYSEESASESSTNEICDRLKDVKLCQEYLVRPIAEPVIAAQVARIMDIFWVIFDQQWPISESQQVKSSSLQTDSSRSQGIISNTHFSSRQYAGPSSTSSSDRRSTIISLSPSSQSESRKKRKQHSDGGRDDSPDGNHHKSRRGGKAEDEEPGNAHFACLFRKHDPAKYNKSSHTFRTCAFSSWSNIDRLKYVTSSINRSSTNNRHREHLHRRQQIAIHCQRCWLTFRTQQQYNEHIILQDICQIKPGHPPDGITPEQGIKLRSRKKLHRSQTEADRWREIYKLLFPDDAVIPSPCEFNTHL